MKIAQVCPYNIFRSGGVQAHIRNLAKELRGRGHEVKIIAPKVEGVSERNKDLILLGNCSEFRINRTQIEISIAMGQTKNPIKDILKKENFDILHFHEPWAPALSMQILCESESGNVGTFHSASPDTFVARSIEALFMPIAKYVVNALDAVIAVSEVPTKFIREFYKGSIEIIPNGIDLEMFNKRSEPFSRYLDGKINIFFIGRLDKRKGVIYLLKAFRRLKKKNDNVRLIIGGKGEELKKVKRYCRKYRLEDVEILGYIKEEDKPRFFSTCDIFCSPALYGESFGIVLVEAMASGKPVVAYANSGYKSVLKGRGALLLVEPKDVKGLMEKLEILAQDEMLRDFMGEWGIMESKKYSWKNICNQVLEVYEKALERKKQDVRDKAKLNIKDTLRRWYDKLNGKLSGKYHQI